MAFLTIRPFNFRNLRNEDVAVDAPEIFLLGENGQGKTNFLEAVYLLCYGSSFRTRNEQILVSNGCDEMSVAGTAGASGSEPDRIQVKLVQGKKDIRVNGKLIKDRRELLENIPCIVFSHDDIHFVTGAPETRRTFINQTLVLSDPSFLDTLRTYNRILKSRNVALRENRKELLDVYDLQLVAAGRSIVTRRERIVAEFNATFTDTFRTVSGTDQSLRIIYHPSWKNDLNDDEVISILLKKRYTDLSYGVTSSGPHRDRFVFFSDGMDFSRIASTGQLRLISLVLRVAQARFFREQVGRKPVMLLDDVLLELDGEKRKRFLHALPEYEQAFFTFLSQEQYAGYRSDKTLVYRVKDGAFE